MDKKKRLFLIDAYALIFRGYYAFIKNPRINSKGVDTSAILGFTNSLFDVIKREKPDYLAVCFDKGGSQDRIKIFDQYKANRDETPEAIKIAVPIIENILKSLNISILLKEGYEADDVIGTVAKKVKYKHFDTYMVTPDKDFAQLVDESIFMYRPVFGGGYETWGINEVLEKFEVSNTSQVIDFLAMKGDSVDNIPGLPGVGDKTAKKFIKQFGSIEELLNNTSELKGKLKEKIEQNKELGILSKKLATIITDVPIEFEIEDLKLKVDNLNKTKEIFEDLEFRRLFNSLDIIFSKTNVEIKNDSYNLTEEKKADVSPGFGQFNLFEQDNSDQSKDKHDIIYQNIQSDMSAKLFLKKIEKQKEFSYNLSTEKLENSDLILKSVSFSWDSNISYVIKNDFKKFEAVLKKIFENENISKISNDLKHDIKLLAKKNIRILGGIFDIKLAHYLINPDISHDLISISNNYLNLSKKTTEELDKITKKIFELSGEEFNISSPKQLGEILFEKMKISDKPKKTKTGQYSTSEEVLTEIASKNDVVKLVLEHRSISKLLNTYIDSLPKQLHKSTNRIHTEYVQTVASTGRLSSINPNLQNIPIRTSRGKEIRKAFIAKNKDYFLMAADYSQIELRIIASLSDEENMINAFKNKEDIHSSTAAAVFNVPINKVTKEQRSNAKVVNFGIIYGVSAFGLSNQTNLTRAESKVIIDNYYNSYPSLKEFMTNQINYARENGFVKTLVGRKRFLNDINSRNGMIRSSAERNAINTPVQGSAADIIKLSMIKIFNDLNSKFMKTKLILQVHDELVFEAPQNEVEQAKKIIIDNMENAYKLEVPLTVDIGVGENWLEAH